MKKLNMNCRSFFSILLMGGIVFFSSCAREKGAVSYNNEKLRKQSQEIENSQPSASNTTVAKIQKNEEAPAATKTTAKVNTTVSSNKTAKNEVAIGKEIQERKLSPVQKLIVKKLNKKQDTAALDKNLKLAIIFGIAGLILSIFGYPIYIIGAILIVVGLVFLLLWVLEQ